MLEWSMPSQTSVDQPRGGSVCEETERAADAWVRITSSLEGTA